MSRTSAIRVRTRFDTVDDFVVGYSPFFDVRGVFVRTRRVQELGTRMRFELQLSDGRAVFRGEGVVDEVREPPLSASGMHLRISKLDRSSKGLFERITAGIEHVGDDPFEAPTFDPDNPPAGLTAATLDQAARAAEAHVEHGLQAAAPTEPASADPLDADVLDEIADGIELSLDAVWSSGSSNLAAAADLGGYFGSPDALAQAALTPQAGAPAVGAPEDVGHDPVPSSARVAPAEDDLVIAPNEVGFGAPAPVNIEAAAQRSATSDAPRREPASVELLGAGVAPTNGDRAIKAEVLRTGGRTPAPPPARPEPPPARPEPPPARPEPPPAPSERPVPEPSPLDLQAAAVGLELSPEDPFLLSSPGEPPRDATSDDALELLEEDQIEDAGAEEEILDAEIIEDAAHVPSPAEILFADADEPAAPSAAEALFQPPIDEVEADDNDLLLGDHSLALASNYVPPAEAGPAADPESERIEDAELVPSGDLERVAEPEPAAAAVPAAPAERTQERSDLDALASATLEHSPSDEGSPSHLRYRFATEDQKVGLGSLLHDLIDEEQSSMQPSRELDLAALTGEHDATEDSGPDAIDELLAREAANEQKGAPKGGLLKRLFGRKKK